jgi:hypothetical protein
MGFLCCSSSDRSGKADAEIRHARIVAVTDAAYNSQRRSLGNYESPPAYHDIVEQPLLSIDEKEPLQFQYSIQSDDDDPPPISSRSSIVSIPTCVAGLTNNDTGSTRYASRRESLDRVSTRASLPPSYYSRRSPSPASSIDFYTRLGDGVSISGHPVMSSYWLDVLRQEQVYASIAPSHRPIAAMPPELERHRSTNRQRNDRQAMNGPRGGSLEPQPTGFQTTSDRTP